MTFIEFCEKLTVQFGITLPDAPTGSDLAPELESRVNGLVMSIRNQKNRLDKVPLAFVQHALEDADIVRSCLEQFDDGNVPDALFETLAMKLYETKFNDLDIQHQNIIEILSVYIIVSTVQDSN